MALKELFLVFLLQFEGISGQTHFYHRPGNDVILPCNIDECSIIYWTYNKIQTHTIAVVRKGLVVTSSDRLSRLSVHSDCSLGIKNITAEDAGLYSCLYAQESHPDRSSEVYLNILTLSASPERDGNISLECSLFRYSYFPTCKQNTISWVDETGTELLSSRFSDNDPIKCVSHLTVNHLSGPNKRYTCQFVQENSVKIEAHYSPVLSGSAELSPLSYGMGALRISVLILMIAITLLVIRHKRRKKPLEDSSVHYSGNQDNGTVNYENVGSSSAGRELH